MGEAVVHGAMRLLTRAHAFEPVGRMLQRQITLAHWWELGFTGQQNVFRRSHFVNVGIIFVVSLFFDDGIAWAAFATVVEERRLFPHETCERRRIVAKAG